VSGAPRGRDAPAWGDYVSAFHARYPGITEDVLAGATSSHGLTPYEWIAAPVPVGWRTLDLACGSGPCLRARRGEPWFGLDRSSEELARAGAREGWRVVRGDARALPFADGAFEAVVCSMALMVVQPVEAVLLEVRRVLVDEGLFVAVLPGRRLARPRDAWRYGRLARRLGRWRVSYPGDRFLARCREVLAAHGFVAVEDQRTGFRVAIDSPDAGARFARSLYAPGASDRRVGLAEALAAGWVGSDITVPLRRLTLRAAGRAEPAGRGNRDRPAGFFTS
jgi:SAM-dependent methyltransferase